MNIQDLLKNYKSNKAKIEMATLEIEQLSSLLQQPEQIQDESQEETIEAMSLATGTTCEVICFTNKFNSKTENVAMSYLLEWSKDPPTKQEIRNRMNDIKSAMYPLELEVKIVERVLGVLTERQRYIINLLYFERCSWTRITEMYEDNFERREETTLRRVRKEALDSMDAVMK